MTKMYPESIILGLILTSHESSWPHPIIWDPPTLAMDLCEGSFTLLNRLHQNLKIITGQKMRFYQKPTFKHFNSFAPTGFWPKINFLNKKS
jgi:hypothetical protein